jgi:hypothetical protein
MLKATALVGSLLLGVSGAAIAADAPQQPAQQLAQAQMQNRSQIEQDYQNRLRAAKTPEERARIQAEYDRYMQQGAVPDSGSTVRTAPGTAGSGTMPAPSNRDSGTRAGESPSGGGSVPSGQGGGGSGGGGR